MDNFNEFSVTFNVFLPLTCLTVFKRGSWLRCKVFIQVHWSQRSRSVCSGHAVRGDWRQKVLSLLGRTCSEGNFWYNACSSQRISSVVKHGECRFCLGQ